MPLIPIPKAFHYTGSERETALAPSGGYIERSSPETECPCWEVLPLDMNQDVAS